MASCKSLLIKIIKPTKKEKVQMISSIKYIFLICLLFLISKELQADPHDRRLPNTNSNEDARGCFTYLLSQEERIDINVDDTVESAFYVTIRTTTHILTNKDAMTEFENKIRNQLLHFESLGMPRELLRDMLFHGVSLSDFDAFLNSNDSGKVH